MSPHAILPLTTLLLALAVPAAAGEAEVGLSVGAGSPGQRNLNLSSGTLVLDTGTTITTQFAGPWTFAGLDLAYALGHSERWTFWARAGYAASLVSRDFAKDGQNSPAALSYRSETINGTVNYEALAWGLGVSLATNQVGEFGLSVDRRSNRTQLRGTRTVLAIPGGGSPGQTGYSLGSTASDFLVTLSMTFLQAHPTFKTYQRIAYGFALGGPSNAIQADAQGWTMGRAYLDRTNPGQELRFGYGFRF